jgi:hypothetical protein
MAMCSTGDNSFTLRTENFRTLRTTLLLAVVMVVLWVRAMYGTLEKPVDDSC